MQFSNQQGRTVINVPKNFQKQIFEVYNCKYLPVRTRTNTTIKDAAYTTLGRVFIISSRKHINNAIQTNIMDDM